MAQIPTGEKRISQINTEITSVNSNSLTTLSTSANSYTGGNAVYTNNVGVAPHGMNEFSGYTHGPASHSIGWSWLGPYGKVEFYNTGSMTGTSVPFGSVNWASLGYRSASNGPFYIYWSGGRNDSWISLTIGSATFTRTGASSTGTTYHAYSSLSSSQDTQLLGNTSGTFSYNS